MLKNYLTIAFRNLLRHKVFSFINIMGLAIGMAACLLVLQYVSFEWSYDDFHEKGDRIYRVTKKQLYEGAITDHSAMTFTATGTDIKAQFPEVTGATTVTNIYGSGVISYGDTKFNEEKVIFADSAFLSVFSFPLIKGDANTALLEPNTALLSESAASKYFGSADPVGKTIQLNKSESYLIKGIFKDVPQNSHIKFDFILSTKYDRNWNNFDYYTYLLLAPGTDPKALEAKFPQLLQGLDIDPKEMVLELQPLRDIHLYSHIRNEAEVNGNINSVYFLVIIALFIIAIAWVNYINLSTAKAIERAREVGIRKVVGAEKTQLIRQFMFESLLMNGIAALIALVIISLLLPFFTELTGKSLSTVLWNNIDFWLLVTFLFLLGAVLSGLYPAFVLSSFKPITVLKGKYSKSSGGVLLRKVLVTTQFAASVILIMGTFTVYKQLRFMQNQDIGMNIDQTLVVVGPKMVDNDKKWDIFRTFKTEVLREPSIRKMTVADNVPGKEIWSANRGFRLGTAPEQAITMYNVQVDYDFIETFELKLIAGRSFSEQYGTDLEEAVILNETASQALGFATPKDAVQQKVVFQGDTLTVAGVINNYHQESLKNNLDPVIFNLGANFNNFFSLKVSTKDLDQTIASVQNKYAQFFPDDPFEYFFLDEFFNKQYQEDRRLGQVFALFAVLAIFVACLGLFGLASFTITQRTKEIGVRKVLGAPVSAIVLLLSKDFIRLVLLSFIIALPIGYYAVYYWLQNYAFHIGISWELFALPGLLILLIVLLTISIQTVKAASVNPVRSLRSE